MTQTPPIFPEDEAFKRQLGARHLRGTVWRYFFFLTIVVALLALIAIGFNVVNQAFGLVVWEYGVDPDTLADRPLEELDEAELAQILKEQAENRLRVIIRDELSRVPPAEVTTRPLHEVLAGSAYPDNLADNTINDLTPAELSNILTVNLSQSQMYDLVREYVVRPQIVQSFLLFDSIFNRTEIEAQAAEAHPNGELEWYSWINSKFVSTPIASDPTNAGLRTALLGSMWILVITVVVAFPLGVGAAIYLEEYATKSFINQIIETNIRNLAGVPSIIYGMLGLAVFVRALQPLTSGQIFGITDSNSRSVLSAGLTMALLILPVIIINAQEAIRAVPSSIRDASYGLGATKWQTIWKQVLPAAVPGILTGVILAMSRAVGETAPLIVIGASTFIGIDPSGPFSKFTVVPIQIYQWTSRPEQEFKNTAAAAIVVLVILLVLFNATAIYLRQRFRRSLSA